MSFDKEKDPRWRLTRFITEPMVAEKGKPDPGLLDLNTEFPNEGAIKLQLFNRMMGQEFGFKSFARRGDRIARVMWSFQRSSRDEAAKSIPFIMDQKALRRAGLWGDESEKDED